MNEEKALILLFLLASISLLVVAVMHTDISSLFENSGNDDDDEPINRLITDNQPRDLREARKTPLNKSLEVSSRSLNSL